MITIEHLGDNTFTGGFATEKVYDTTLGIYQDHPTDFVLLSEQELVKAVYYPRRSDSQKKER